MAEPRSNARLRLAGPSNIPVGGYPPAPLPVTESPAVVALRGVRSSALSAAGGQESAQGIRDVVGRTAAAVLGTPVDVAAMALRPAGYAHPAPMGGSEWIGRQLEGMGTVSPVRRPAAELLASLPAPAGASKLGGAIAAAMSPEGKARLLADLLAGKGSGAYRLGDVSQGQATALQRLGMPPDVGRDVMMTDKSFNHLVDARVSRDGFQPEEVVRFAKQAMEPRSKVLRDPAGAGHKPALANDGLLDPSSGRKYTAQMPLRAVDGQMEVVSVIPRGLASKKTKAP